MLQGCQTGVVPEHYQRPGWFTTHVFNRLVAALTRMGVSVVGSRVLEIKGRKSGEWRQTPVNLLRLESAEYLVAPRGHTQWVKNLRASGDGRLRVGRHVQPFTAVELSDEEKPPVLRAVGACRRAGATRVDVAATHASFAPEARRLFDPGIPAHERPDSVVVTDSVPLAAGFSGYAKASLTVLGIAPVLAEAIGSPEAGCS